MCIRDREIPLVGHTAGAVVPEVVMRVADGELRLQGGFLGQSQPIVKAKGIPVPQFIGIEAR